MSDLSSDSTGDTGNTDGYRTIAELDDAVAAGRISFDRYWTVRAALDDIAAKQREEHAYDPAPVAPAVSASPSRSTRPGRTSVGRGGPAWSPVRTVTPPDYLAGSDPMPGFVPPPPRPARTEAAPASPKPLVSPPPSSDWQPGGPVTLPITGPSAEAGSTRADDRRRRRRKR